MASLQCVPPESVITGWDFSTGGVKCLAFDLEGKTLAEVRWETDLWHGTPEQWRRDPQAADQSELNLLQLEGQARATVRGMAAKLRSLSRLEHWIAGGISATHHTAGRIDAQKNPLRRAICWNDQTLPAYHKLGLKRLGGKKRPLELIGGPWAIRYSLSHLVKDEDPKYTDPRLKIWEQTYRILPHGALAAGYLTGNFDVISVSAAASTGLMNLIERRWQWQMLDALKFQEHRKLVRQQLPRIIDQYQPIGPLAEHIACEAGLGTTRPILFPTSDDQQAGLVGGGAVKAGQLAVILGNSAVVNSSSEERPLHGNLDVMRLNWGPYLWMRCYNNGAQFLDALLGIKPNWATLERAARKLALSANSAMVLPFEHPEPSLAVAKAGVKWFPARPTNLGELYLAALESLAYLVALGVEEHERAGQKISEITVSGGIARSDLMCEILASVLNRRLTRLESAEGPALGAAVTALAAIESYRRGQQGIEEPYLVSDAVPLLVRLRDPVNMKPDWVEHFRRRYGKFRQRLDTMRKGKH